FIEWASNARSASIGDAFGVSLEGAVAHMIDSGLDYQTAKRTLENGGYFSRMGRDASPTLLELTALAIAKRVPVAPCDTDPKDVMTEVSKRGQGGGPDGRSVSEFVLFADPGIKVRDEKTVVKIRHVMEKKGINQGLLMLWGDNHFRGNDYRQGLDTLLKN